MKHINLCAVAMGSTMDALVGQILLCQKEADFVEARIDYLDDQKNISLDSIKKSTTKNVIVTCRRKDEGGKWHGKEKDRLHVLRQAFDLGFSFVDLELQTLEEGRFKIPQSIRTKTIISFHDFNKTPNYSELKKIGVRMQKFNPDIKKIATMIKNEDDIHSLYRLLIEKKKEEKYCVIGMGELGKQIRVVSPLLGGCITYCSINDEGSAPGQMSCRVMRKIYELIH